MEKKILLVSVLKRLVDINLMERFSAPFCLTQRNSLTKYSGCKQKYTVVTSNC